MSSPAATVPHLRAEEGEHATTNAELFFDLVYVFAITQLSHLLLHGLTVAGAGRTAFLLLAVWWAWISVTWMLNRFDPESDRVRAILLASMLVSLLMSAAIPHALTDQGLLFAGAYVALQTGRNIAAVVLLPAGHVLRDIYERMTLWSLLSAAFWLGGCLVDGDARLLVWAPALAVDVIGPLTGYAIPRRPRIHAVEAFGVDGGHFAERCQLFLMLALGESVVITGATAADAGLTTEIVFALAVAFLGTGALWWLYFGEIAEHSRDFLRQQEDAGRLARDAYTYLHIPIIAGVIVTAVGDDLLLAHPNDALSHVGVAVMLGGPALYLLGDNLFRLRMIGSINGGRLLTMVLLIACVPLGTHVSALALAAIAAALLSGVALREQRRGGVVARPAAPLA